MIEHDWRDREFVGVPHEDSQVIEAVHAFAKRLEQHFAELSGQSAASSVWPQEATVCALCERIVTPRSFDGVTCSQDGDNPPTKTVKVVLAAG